MNKTLWNGVGQIGDDLIADANDSTVRNHFKRKKRNLWIKCSGIAAGLCLVVGLCVPLIKTMMQGKNEGSGSCIWITEPTQCGGDNPVPEGDKPSLSWTDVLAYSLRIEKSVYTPSELPIMDFGYGLTNNTLGNGTLKISIDTGDFTTTVQTEITVDDFTYSKHSGREANKLSIPLIHPKEDSFGTIQIAVLFYPSEVESSEYAKYLSDGALPVGAVSLSYVVNEYETVFSQTSAADLFEIRLVRLYETGIIDAKEFADRYFAFIYGDTVCASVSSVKQDGSYNFCYRSKNIRYDSPYITDPAIKNAMDSPDERLIVRLALEQMLLSGVITQSEYETELAWVAEVRYAGMYDIAFDQNVAKYAHKVLQKNMYTHK